MAHSHSRPAWRSGIPRSKRESATCWLSLLGLLLCCVVSGCDKLKIPGVNDGGAAAAPAGAGSDPAANAQAMPSAPATLPEIVSKPDPKAEIQKFLDKAKVPGGITEGDLLAAAELPEEARAEVKKLHIGGDIVSDTGLAALPKFSNLDEVNLSGATRFTNTGLKSLTEMESLETLGMNRTRLDAESLAIIADIKNLKNVDISQTGTNDAALIAFDKLESLESLDLTYTGVTGFAFSKMKTLPPLKSLTANHTPMHDDAMQILARIPTLETLSLGETGLTDKGLMHIGKMKNLKTLNVGFCGGLSDFGTRYLDGASKLEVLNFHSSPRITNRSLTTFVKLRHLKEASFVGTSISADGAAELARRIPGLKVGL